MDNLDDMVTYYDGDSQSKLRKADLGMRIGAFIIDYIIMSTVLVMPFIVFTFKDVQNNPAAILSMSSAFMLAGFFVYCSKDIIKGASLGKRMFGLAVRESADSLEIPSVFKLFIRNIFTFAWPIEFLVLVCSTKKIKIGDRIASTDVYRISKKPKISLIVISAILMVAIFVGSLLFGISTIFKNDNSYKMAVGYIETDPKIMDLTVDIEGYGFMPSGSLNYSGEYGHASYTIKVIGSQNTIYVHMQLEKKPDKDWEIIYYDYGK